MARLRERSRGFACCSNGLWNPSRIYADLKVRFHGGGAGHEDRRSREYGQRITELGTARDNRIDEVRWRIA
ncbi:hypothetical protein M0R45_036094 [Rubus argutus]|uniref:Uncharacterized protein n=1 Tax=Rubus argutus TaxID=59490 RepID=A0AAW1VV33_RUBAR